MKTTGALLLTLGLWLALYGGSTAQTSCSSLKIAFGESGRGHVGERVYFTICPSPTWDSVHYSVLHLPPGFGLSEFHEGDPCITISGSPIDPGTFEFSVAATGSSEGDGSSMTCNDTLTFTRTYICFPENTFQPLSPDPGAVNPAKVGQSYDQEFAVQEAGYETTPVRFEVTAGAVPPGLSFTTNPGFIYITHLAGTPTTAGDYHFTLSAFFGSCLALQREYSVLVESSDCGPIHVNGGGTGPGLVGELINIEACLLVPVGPGDSIAYSVLHLPPGFDTHPSTGAPCITIFGSPTDPGTFEFSVAASSSGGCQDTLTFTRSFICFPNSFPPLSPSPDELSPARVGQPYNQVISFPETGFELTHFRFEVTAGALPSEITLTNGSTTHSRRLTGTPSTTGDYSFTISAYLGNCLAVEQNYVLHVLDSTTACEPIIVHSDYIGQEFHVGDTVVINHPYLQGGTPPYVFSADSIPPGASFNSSGTLKFFASHPGEYSYTIQVTDSSGCSGMFSSTVTVMCNPVALTEATLANGKKGQHYEQPVPTTHDIVGPFSNFQTSMSLPAGLSLSGDGIISGTPTVFGVFMFITIGYQGLAGCSGRTDINITILNNVPVKTLYLYSLCSESDQVRNWKVHNQNNFNVKVTWETLYFNTYSDTINAVPGDNFFTTPNVGGPNTIRIKWADGNGNIKSLTQPSINNLCTPPACVIATSVDFYHQGVQKDGNHVPAAFSNAASALGEPDANDAADGGTRAFSLGFDGFIILQLNANLVDQPGNDLIVYEYSANNPSFYNYPERAQVFASMNGIQWVSLGVTSPSANCQQKLDTEFDLAGKIAWCRYIKILDITNRHAKILNAATCSPTPVFAFNNASNGFDVDAVTCAQSKNSNLAGGRTDTSTEGFLKGTSAFQSVLYPNPTPGLLVIDFSQEPEFVYPEGGEVQVDIIDMNGASLYKNVHQLDEQWTTKCDINQLPAGLFITKVNVGAQSHFYKLVKY